MNKTALFLVIFGLLGCGSVEMDGDPGVGTGGSGALGGSEQAGSGGEMVENQAGMGGFSAGGDPGSGAVVGGIGGNSASGGQIGGAGSGGTVAAGGTGGTAAPLICDGWKVYVVQPYQSITIKGGAFWLGNFGTFNETTGPGPVACSLEPWTPKNVYGTQTQFCYFNEIIGHPTTLPVRVWFKAGPGSAVTVKISTAVCAQ